MSRMSRYSRPSISPYPWIGTTCGSLTPEAACDFATEPPLEDLVLGQLRRQHLERDDPIGLGVVGPVDLAHAAAAEQFEQLVMPEGRRPPPTLPGQPPTPRRSRLTEVTSPWTGTPCVRSCCGLPSTSRGLPLSTITPPSMNTSWSATSRAKPISWVTTTIVMPSSASFFMTSSTSPTSSGSSAEVGSSNSISLGSIASARAIATRCCWPPDSCAG